MEILYHMVICFLFPPIFSAFLAAPPGFFKPRRGRSSRGSTSMQPSVAFPLGLHPRAICTKIAMAPSTGVPQ